MRQTKARVFARRHPRLPPRRRGADRQPVRAHNRSDPEGQGEFGKMVKLQEAENQIVITYEVYDQPPSDSDLLIAAIETHQGTLAAHRIWWLRTPASTRPRMRWLQSQRHHARLHPQPIHQKPRAQIASRRSAGSATARNGAPAVKGASASSNGGTASTAVGTKGMPE